MGWKAFHVTRSTPDPFAHHSVDRIRRMTRAPPKHRWLQFSLRSVLLLTLAVALWLGYEVREARQVERTITALCALGGTVVTELTCPDPLRLFGAPGYC